MILEATAPLSPGHRQSSSNRQTSPTASALRRSTIMSEDLRALVIFRTVTGGVEECCRNIGLYAATAMTQREGRQIESAP